MLTEDSNSLKLETEGGITIAHDATDNNENKEGNSIKLFHLVYVKKKLYFSCFHNSFSYQNPLQKFVI